MSVPSLEPGRGLLRGKSPQPVQDTSIEIQSQPQFRRVKSPSPNREKIATRKFSEVPKMPERFKSPKPPQAPLSPEPFMNGESKMNGALNGNVKTTASASQPELTEDWQGGTRKKVVKVVRRVVRRVVPAEEDTAKTPAAMSPEPVVEPPKPEPASVPKVMKMPVFSFKHDSIKKEEKDDISAGLSSLMTRGRTREPRPRIRKDEPPEKEGVQPVENEKSGPAQDKTVPKIETSQTPKQEQQTTPKSPVSPPAGFIPTPKHNPLSPPSGFVPTPKPLGFVPTSKPSTLSPPPGFIPAPKPSPVTPAGFVPTAPVVSPPPIADPKTLPVTPSSTPALPKAAATSAPTAPGKINTLNPPAPKTDPFAPPSGFIPTSKQMPVKKPEVKTEEQIAAEQAWYGSEKVWLVHKDGFSLATVVKTEAGSLPEGKVKIKLEHDGTVLDVDEDDVEKANPPSFDRCEDLAALLYLNESSVMHSLRQRYGGNLIHTYAGPNMVIINPTSAPSMYSEKVMHMFKGCRREDTAPHIYAVAQSAYRNLLTTRQDQSIVLLGKSGSGKTTNCQHLVQYLVSIAGSTGKIFTAEKWQAVYTILEAFGNSPTSMNNNASRFSQIVSLDFDQAGQVASASIQTMLLEKLRVVKRPEAESTFNVFYYMMAGADSTLRTELHFNHFAENSAFGIVPQTKTEEKQKASQQFTKLQAAMKVLGISSDEQKALWLILGAIYHLGAAGATKAGRKQFARHEWAQKAAYLLGCTLEELSSAIFKHQPKGTLQRSTSFRQGPDDVGTGDNSAPKITALECLEAMGAGLYSELFTLVISLVNRALKSSQHSLCSLLIVDTPGFQNPKFAKRDRGATFEELCHNYTQERLQTLFHERTFVQELERYKEENIELALDDIESSTSLSVSAIDQASTQALVRTLARTDEARGLLWLMEEEALQPGGSEETLLERLFSYYSPVDGESKGPALLLKSEKAHHFLLGHSHGTDWVEYDARGWLSHAKQNPASQNAAILLQDSQKKNISGLFMGRSGGATVLSGSIAGLEGGSQLALRRATSMRKTFTTGVAAVKKKSLCIQIKLQVDALIDTVRRSRVHFVHCLLPKAETSAGDLKVSGGPSPRSGEIETHGESCDNGLMQLDVCLLRAQLRGSKLLDALRIYRQGYPDHLVFSEFRRRFDVLTPHLTKKHGRNYIVTDERRRFTPLVFFRAGVLAKLEEHRDIQTRRNITLFQAACRGYLARQAFKKRKIQDLAIRCIQKNIKKNRGVKGWPWWKLFTTVRPLIEVQLTEEQIRGKDEEIQQLRLKLEKVEKERNELRLNSDRLESKITELSSELADERNTGESASQLLESETSERLRLEKDMKDLQAKFDAMKKQMESMEMEVMEARLIRASELNGEMDDDDTGGEWRLKYERAIREIEFTKKRLQQEFDDKLEVEQQNKRQLERKVSHRDVETEKRLRKDLKRTKALLADAQIMLDHLKNNAPSKREIAQLKNQLEESEFTCAAAVKARKSMEVEIEDLHVQMDDISKSKQALEEQLSRLQREKNDLQSRMEEDQEDMNELMKKHKAAVAQSSQNLAQISDLQAQLEEAMKEKQDVQEKLTALQSQLEFQEQSMVDKSLVSRQEAKIRELETKLEFEKTQVKRLESLVARLKENLEKLTEERDQRSASENREKEQNKRLLRQIRDIKEEMAELAKKEAEASRKKHELEMDIESLEAANQSLQADLKLAFKRIGDLQAAIEDEMESDDNEDLINSEGGSDTDSEVEDRVDGVKSWLSKNKGSAKNLSDDGSLKSSRFAVNVDGKEGKEWDECKDWKDSGKGKELEPSRPVSVMSSLSYRKRSNIKDSIGGKGDESSLLNTLKEQSDSQDLSSFRKNKAKLEAEDDSYSVSSWRKAGDDLDDRGSVISQAYSEAASRARKGMDSRWSEFDKESVVSSVAPSRVSTCRSAMDLDDDAISSVSRMSSVSRRRSMPRLDDRQSEYGSAVSPSFSRRSPGSVSRADSRMSISRSCRLSEFDVDDDARSIAFSEARSSAYSPHSTSGRSFSMPPQARATDSSPPDVSDVKPVSHRNYLDPDLEAAINEVLSFKPIKFKRTSLEDSEAEKDKPVEEEEDDRKSITSSRTGRESGRSSSLRRSASAVDFMRSSSSLSTRSSRSKKGKSKKKKKRSHSSESDSSDDDRKKKSSKKKGKKSKKKSKKESSSSSSSSESESSTESDSSSGASTISYRSSSSIKKAPARQASGSEEELEPEDPSEGAPPRSKKEEKKRKKKVDNLMMKYLYRPDSE
ncbi:unconventional myosin-XVIIIa-like isoform X1 [Labeo rohita]|uniref:Unconventional myosin-XVIIIa-like isoform X1 n=1 Tax=Labeo rohita TaxID=84645 RepID=A0A498LH92_LABRO|nr:unconventional myosin-XVIIIa-like isoform X1 [Labeo rohita]